MDNETRAGNVSASDDFSPGGSALARLVIADDHDIARSGLRSMLEGEPDLEVVGEARNGHEAVELCLRLPHDLVLMDVQMPKKNGLAAARQIKEELPGTRVVMMTIYESPRYLSEALKAGADGYILKDAARSEIIDAVRKALRGEPLSPPELSPRTSNGSPGREISGPKPPPEHLTPRELEILRLMAEGKTNREIAGSLMISPGTAKIHVRHISTKLAASDRTQAVVRALELGLLNASG